MINYELVNTAIVLAIVCMIPLAITAIYSIAEFIVIILEAVVKVVSGLFHIDSDKDD